MADVGVAGQRGCDCDAVARHIAGLSRLHAWLTTSTPLYSSSIVPGKGTRRRHASRRTSPCASYAIAACAGRTSPLRACAQHQDANQPTKFAPTPLAHGSAIWETPASLQMATRQCRALQARFASDTSSLGETQTLSSGKGMTCGQTWSRRSAGSRGTRALEMSNVAGMVPYLPVPSQESASRERGMHEPGRPSFASGAESRPRQARGEQPGNESRRGRG
jgi:hypothetical protein